MANYERVTAVGVFDDRLQAERTVEELRSAGFPDDEMGIVARGDGEPASKVAQGLAAGAMGGGTLGALAGLAVAAGIIPGIGPAIAGGILGGVLASSAVGAAAGGLLGALVGLGVPEDEARYYESELETGRTLVTVRADGRFEEAAAILRRCGAYDMTDRLAGADQR